MNQDEEAIFWMKVANLYMEQASDALKRANDLQAETRQQEHNKDVRWLLGKAKVPRLDAS